MKGIFKYFFLACSLFLFDSALAQSPNTPDVLFASRFRITNAVNGTLDTIVVSGYVDDCTTRFENDDVAIADSLYVLEGTDLLIFGVVTTPTVSLGIATFKVIDFNGAGLLPSAGQAAIIRPTGNYKLPVFACNLDPSLQQFISARFSENLDNIISDIAGALPDSTAVIRQVLADTAAAIRADIGSAVIVGDSLDQLPAADEILGTDRLVRTDGTITFQKLINQTRDSLQVDTIIAINTAVTSATVTGLIKQNRKDVHLFLTMTSAETQDESIALPAVSTLTGNEGLRLTISVKDSDDAYSYYVLPNAVTTGYPELIVSDDRYANRYDLNADETAVFILARNSTGLVWKLESTTYQRGIVKNAKDFKKYKFVRGDRVIDQELGATYEITNVPVSTYNSNNPDSSFVHLTGGDKARWSKNYILRSEELNNASWAYPGDPDIIVLTDFEVAPNGRKIAERWVKNATGGHNCWTTAFTTQVGEKWTLSFWAKSGVAASNDNAYLRANLAFDNTVLQDIQVDSEWRRYSMTHTVVDAFASERYSIFLAGDAGDSIDITMVQVEKGDVVSDYKRTESTASTEGTLYAVYKPTSPVIEVDQVSQGRLNDSDCLERAAAFAVTQKEKTVFCRKNRTITETVTLPMGSSLRGTYDGGAIGAEYESQGTVFRLDLNNASLNAFEFAATGTYEAGGVIEGIMMVPVSSGRAAIKTNDGYFQQIKNVSIENFPSTTEHLSYGIDITTGSLALNIDRVKIRHASVAGIFFSGSTLLNISNSMVQDSEVGIISTGDGLRLENVWFENIDSCAIIHTGTNSIVNLNRVYTEDVPENEGSVANTMLIKSAGNFNATGVLFNGEGDGNTLLKLENVRTANIIGSRFVNANLAIETTSATGTVTLIGNQSSVTIPPASFEGIYDSTKVTVLGANTSTSNTLYNNLIPRLETYDADINISQIDSGYLHQPTIHTELLLNSPTIGNRNENLVRTSEVIAPANGWSGSASAAVTNDTIAPDGTVTAEKIGHGGNNLLRMTPLVTMETGEYFTYSFYYANSTFDYAIVSIGTNTPTDPKDTLFFTNSSEWVRYDFSGKHVGANDYCDITFSGVSGDSIHFWGAQLERNRYKGDYIRTTGTAITADLANPSLNIPDGKKLHFAGTVEIDSLVADYHDGQMIFTDSMYTITITGIDPITNGSNNLFESTSTGNVSIAGDSIIVGLGRVELAGFISLSGTGVYKIGLEINGTPVDNYGAHTAVTGDTRTWPIHYTYHNTSGTDIIKPTIEVVSGVDTTPEIVGGSIDVKIE